MNSPTNNISEDDDLPAEIDFSQGERGKFFHPDLKLDLPIYLDEDVQNFLAGIAARKGLAISEVANNLLKQDMAMFDVMR